MIQKRIIIVGATGMVGGDALRFCSDQPDKAQGGIMNLVLYDPTLE